MDYKFIVLLIVLLGLILFFTKELDNVRREFDSKMNQVITCVDNSAKSVKSKIQTDIDNCTSKIKSINGEYIDRVRRMNIYGAQPITNMSNNYTDGDSDNQGQNNYLRYLSSVKEGDDLTKEGDDHTKEGGSFYMSDDDLQKEANFNISYTDNNAKPKISSVQGNNMSSMKKEQMSSQQNNTTSPKKEHMSSQYNNITSIKKNTTSSKQSNSEQNIIDKDDFKNVSSAKKKDTTSSSSTSNSSESESYKNDSSSDGVPIEIPQNIPKKKKQQKSSEVQIKQLLSKKQDNDSADSNSMGSEFGQITFGSKKSQPKQNIQSDSESEDSSDMKSEFVSKLTSHTLKPITKYTLDTIKSIAKQLSIPMMYKDGTTRKYFKKDELYDKIKSHLKNKVAR